MTSANHALGEIDPHTAFLYTPRSLTFLLCGNVSLSSTRFERSVRTVVGSLIILSGTFHREETSVNDEQREALSVSNARNGIWTVIFVFIGTVLVLSVISECVSRLFDCPRTDYVDGQTSSSLLEVHSWSLRCLLPLCDLAAVPRSPYC